MAKTSPSIGTVTLLHGVAHATEASGEERILQQGSPLFQEDSVRTSTGAHLEADFADGTMLTQGGNSVTDLGGWTMVAQATSAISEHRHQLPSSLGLEHMAAANALPEQESSGQRVLLLYNGLPVVQEAQDGEPRQVLTTDGLVEVEDGTDLGDYYNAGPEEIARLQSLAQELLQPEAIDGGFESFPAFSVMHGLSVVTPEGGVMLLYHDALTEIPVYDIPDYDDGYTVDDIIDHFDESEYGQPPIILPEDPPVEEEKVEEPIDSTLDLSNATEAMRVDLSVPEYVPVAGGTAAALNAEVVNVVGATDYDNIIIGDDRANHLTGGLHTDEIRGNDGNDTIAMGTGLDTTDVINGGDGTDVLEFTQSAANPTNALNGVTNVEYIRLGDADTTLTLTNDNLVGAGQTVTVDATGIVSGGKLVFDGTAETDGSFSFLGSQGDDTIRSGAGNDTLQGGAGVDHLYGENGNDSILGGAGEDSIIGGEGADTIDGGADNDTLYGENGNDSIRGGAGNDAISGNDGADTLDGGTGDDHLLGGDGNDTVLGGDGADYLRGDDGADTLDGGAGDDTVSGGADDDVIQGGAGADTLSGGGGTNTLSYASSTVGVIISLESSSASGGDAEGDVVSDWTEFQNVMGSATGDTLEGRALEANKIEGLDGNDLLKATTGGDTLDGGSGNDTFYFNADPAAGTTVMGGSGTDFLQGSGSTDYSDLTYTGVEGVLIGAGQYARFSGSQLNSDWIVTGAGGAEQLKVQMNGTSVDLSGLSFDSWTSGEDVVHIIGTSNTETIIGSSADDSIVSGGGADTISGGAGNDTIYLTSSPGSGISIDGGAGTDMLYVENTTNPVSLLDATSITNIETIYINGELGLTAAQANGQEWTIGSDGSDTLYIYGSTAADTADLYHLNLTGFHGDIAFYGDSGNDSITMGTNLDHFTTVNGGSGTDTLSFTYNGNANVLDTVTNVEYITLGNAATTLTLGNDNFVTSGQTVTIDGSGLTQSLTFNGANETDGHLLIKSGSANDAITGGSGNDTIEGGAGADVIEGGGGTNTISYASSQSGVNVSLNAGTATGGDATGDTVTTWTNFQHIMGSSANDVLEGRDGEDNKIEGFDGNDLLTYTSGKDTLDGGSGNDTFQFNAAVESGTVVTGGAGTDIIQVNASSDFTSATVTGVEGVTIGAGQYARFDSSMIGSDWTVTGSTGAEQLRVQMDTTSVDLSAASFSAWTAGQDTVQIVGTGNDETIIGSSGDDSILSGGGADTISGGTGNDTIALTSTPGSGLSIDGGSGTDVLSVTGTVSLQDATSIANIETITLDGSMGLSAAQANGQEWTIGSDGSDTLTIFGTTAANTADLSHLNLSGFNGDLLFYGDGGNDAITMGTNLDHFTTVNGGSGTDTLTFTYNGHSDALDGVTNVEYITVLSSTAATLTSLDTLVAGGSTVTIDGSGLTENFTFNGSAETTGNLVLIGGSGNDTLTGGDGDDTISGGAGADRLDGGSGDDFVSYAGSSAGVAVYIDGLNINSGGDATGDILSGFKGVIGSAYDDYLYGSENYSTAVYGGDGDDTIKGEGGDNTLCGGAGDDSIEVGTGFDTIVYESFAEIEDSMDTITGFTSGMDKLVFGYQDFIGLKGDLDPVRNFFTSLDSVKSSPCFIFDNNVLYYDDDGYGSTEAEAIAYFDGGTVAYDDIEIV